MTNFMNIKLFLIIAMFLSGTGVLAEELPTRGLAPVNKITHPFFFQSLLRIKHCESFFYVFAY